MTAQAKGDRHEPHASHPPSGRRPGRAGLRLAGLALAVPAVPAFATPVPPPGTEFRPSAPVPTPVRTVTHTLVLGGMPGWQIGLIATAAALAAATLTVLAYGRALPAARQW